MSSATTLLTGFEPFGGAMTNPSQVVAEAMRELELPDLVAAVLPTSYARCATQLAELIAAHRPALVLMLGLDDHAESLKLERVALNLDDADAPDVDGDIRVGRRIARDGPVAYWSGLDLDAMARTATRLEEKVTFSHDAGGYVCNHAFFTAAHLTATSAPQTRAGFVHLPPAAGDDARLSQMIRVVHAWLTQRSL